MKLTLHGCVGDGVGVKVGVTDGVGVTVDDGVSEIKSHLIKGYRDLITDNNVLHLIRKWKKNG